MYHQKVLISKIFTGRDILIFIELPRLLRSEQFTKYKRMQPGAQVPHLSTSEFVIYAELNFEAAHPIVYRTERWKEFARCNTSHKPSLPQCQDYT
jgi:hypothetical protein